MPFLSRSRALSACLLLLTAAAPVVAQTVDDGIMLTRGELQAGGLYVHDTWDEYWEGELKRRNGNIGRITTRSQIWTANYAVTSRVNVIATIPYIRTGASQGVLHGSKGLQDLGIAVKWNRLEKPDTPVGSLRLVAVASAGIPLTDYNVELLPLSIGLHSTRLAARATFHVQTRPGWFATTAGAYTVRSHVRLDRPYFYTDDEFVMSDQVDMPNTFESSVSGGYMRRGLMAAAFYSQQHTLGGGDIRRQDMPFVSNRMNASRVGAMAIVPVPTLSTLAVQLGVAQTVGGRNVGQSTTVTAGLLYRLLGGSTR